jgi:3-oxoacyl-[acyl-carrier-protein] synthase-1
MIPLAIRAYTTSNAAGIGNAATAAALRDARSGLAPNDLDWAPLPCWIGRVRAAEQVALPAALAPYDCRNNRLALLGLEQDGFSAAVAAAKRRHGASRVGVFLGTSTSGIRSTEIAYRQRDPRTGSLPGDLRYETTHNLDATTEFVRLVSA